MWHTPMLAGVGCNCYLCQPKPSLGSYLPRPAVRPPRENAYYIVAVSGGTVLSKRPDGLYNKDAVNSDTQRWRVEYDSGENRVALMNVSDGKWLRAFSGASYGRVDTSDEKQWWVMEEGSSPGSCWLKCDEFANVYLCNANGSFVDGNATYTKSKQLDRAHAQTWTLRDADAVGYDAKGWRISVLSEEQMASIEMGEREQAVLEKESSLSRRESMLLEKERRLSVQVAEQKTQLEELVAKGAELRKLSDELTAKATVQQEQAVELLVRESELSGCCGCNSTNKDIAMLKAENDNLHLQLRTSSLEREVEKVKQRSASINRTEQLRNLEVEKARLRVLLHAEQQKARSSPSPKKARDTPPVVFNSPSSLATRAGKESKLPALIRRASRPGSSSASTSRPVMPSRTATPKPSLRYTSEGSPSTPSRPSTGVLSSTSNTQRSYDSRYSGWPEDDVYIPATPTKHSKRTVPSTIGPPTPIATVDRNRLSKESLLLSDSHNRRIMSNQTRSPAPGSSVSQTFSVSSTSGKVTSKSTPARSQPPRMATLRYGAPDGMMPLRDDGDALIYACGHKVFKPPRKLNKTVVGYLYE